MRDPTVDNLILDLLSWLASRERSYQETIDVWITSCPRLPVWEEANDEGLLRLRLLMVYSLCDSRRPGRNCCNKETVV
jgi:hypothetical protein